MCLKFEVCLARSRWCTRRDNHKSKLLTSCFRPISWQPQKRDNAEIAILMWARFAAFFYKKNSWKAHAHQASYLAGARARLLWLQFKSQNFAKKGSLGVRKNGTFCHPTRIGVTVLHTHKKWKKDRKRSRAFLLYIFCYRT